MGLYTPTILVGNSYLSWFYDRGGGGGGIKDPAHTGTSEGLSRVINRGPIRKFLPKYANVYVTIQSHGLSERAWTHYVTANGVRNGLLSSRRVMLTHALPVCPHEGNGTEWVFGKGIMKLYPLQWTTFKDSDSS